MAAQPKLVDAYDAAMAAAARGDLMGDEVGSKLEELIRRSLKFLNGIKRQPLKCDTGKSYFSFVADGKISRAINDGLFDAPLGLEFCTKVLRCEVDDIESGELKKALYTMAISYCAAADLTKKNDKKTPATFFEKLVGHLVGRRLGVNPINSIEVQSLDIHNQLPTDFIFDLGPRENKIHMPVKTSTRERVIQVWAHQRVIDGVFGVGRFKGVLVCLAETNAKPKFGVTEVCLPNQWTIYQMFIAQLHRVYYFDLPRKYADLGAAYPFIQVKDFAAFFPESEHLAKAPPVA